MDEELIKMGIAKTQVLVDDAIDAQHKMCLDTLRLHRSSIVSVLSDNPECVRWHVLDLVIGILDEIVSGMESAKIVAKLRQPLEGEIDFLQSWR